MVGVGIEPQPCRYEANKLTMTYPMPYCDLFTADRKPNLILSHCTIYNPVKQANKIKEEL